jgi:uncharacterized protein
VTGSSHEAFQPDGVASPLAGSPVRLAMTKWGDLPHWEFDGVLLGSDRHGDWVGIVAGTHMSRPGSTYVAPVDQVSLVPGPGTDLERSFLATFHAVGGQVSVYVDMTTPPRWDGDTLSAVDLDLDVVRGTSGRIWIDDEDEFAEHRVSLGYPERVVALTSASCDRIHALVSAGTAPFDEESAAPWFAMLHALVTDRPSPGGPRAV